MGERMVTKEEQLEDLLQAIWHQDVVKVINEVLMADKYFGFKHFEMHADPSIDDISHSLNLIDAMLLVFIANKQHIGVAAESVLLNCQQCVHLMRRAFVALRSKNEAEYADVMDKLKGHAGAKTPATVGER